MAARPMVRSLFLFGLLATTAASAQAITLKYALVDTESYRFNATSCNAEVRVDWTSTITLNLCSDMRLWVTELECGEKPGATDVSFTSVSQADLAKLTGNFNVKLSELPGFKYGDAGVICGTEGVEKSHRICGSVSVTNLSSVCTVQSTSSLSAIYDTRPPVSPTIDEVNAQDGALALKVTASSDAIIVRVEVRPQGTADFVERASFSPTSGSSVRISGLTNGTTYDVQARSEDAASNRSAPSELVSGTPELTKGFWARYRDAGGAQQGGCQAVHGFPLLLAGGLWLLQRRKRK